jgi:hypothetical protein
MAISFDTNDPQRLLNDFKKAIDRNAVETWTYDKDGDFTHTPDQWKNEAWLRPVIYPGRLVMNFLGNNSKKTTKVVYGVYHGRFIESMLMHCDKLFTNAHASALATNSDFINTAA